MNVHGYALILEGRRGGRGGPERCKKKNGEGWRRAAVLDRRRSYGPGKGPVSQHIVNLFDRLQKNEFSRNRQQKP